MALSSTTSGSSGLQNPITVLYREVWNEHASWTDALFWYGLGLLTAVLVWMAH